MAATLCVLRVSAVKFSWDLFHRRVAENAGWRSEAGLIKKGLGRVSRKGETEFFDLLSAKWYLKPPLQIDIKSRGS